MSNQEPLIIKTCGILSNRSCLVVFAVFKIVADFMTSCILAYLTLVIIAFAGTPEAIWFLVVIFVLLLDITFMILLIVATCKKSNLLIKILFHYSILSLVAAFVTNLVLMIMMYGYKYFRTPNYDDKQSVISGLLAQVAIVVVYTLVHVYMILLMKSEDNRTRSNGFVYSDQESIVDQVNSSNQSNLNKYLL